MKTTAALVTTTIAALMTLAPAFAQSATTNQGWSATLVDRNSPLMQGSDMGDPKALLQPDTRNMDPISQLFQSGIDTAMAAGKSVIDYVHPSQVTPHLNLNTPEGRFAYYQPIMQRRAQELNREQASQQTQYTVPATTENLQQASQQTQYVESVTNENPQQASQR